MTYTAILRKHLSISERRPSSNNKILIPFESILRFVTSLSRNIGELCIPRTYETTSDTRMPTHVEVCSPPNSQTWYEEWPNYATYCTIQIRPIEHSRVFEKKKRCL